MPKMGMKKDPKGPKKKSSLNKISIRKADRLFTRYMRIRQDFTCQKCGRKFRPGIDNMRNLGVSHFWGRRYEATRFDMENCDLACNIPCHQDWEKHKDTEYKEFMINKIGQERYDLLELRAHTIQKRDDALIEMWLENESKRYRLL